MKRLQLLLHDRRRRQRGSVLSALLIIVAFLAILIGGLLTQLTDAFVLSRDLATRVQNEATVSSAVELTINQLQTDVKNGAVPANCAQDPRKPPATLTLNGRSAVVRQEKCTAILPEVARTLAAGSFNVDGFHDTLVNRYLVANTAGTMYSYNFTTGALNWEVSVGGQPTAPPSTMAGTNNSVNILAPVTNRMVLLNGSGGGAPTVRCNLAASGTVQTATAGVAFPGYVFFGDSSKLYVYDTTSSNCGPAALTSTNVGGRVVGAPLVFSSDPGESGSSDEVFVLVTSSSVTSLQHWTYTEVCNDGEGEGGGNCDNGRGNRQPTLRSAGSISLNGPNAVGYDTNGSALPMSLVVATSSGRLDLARISGSFNMSAGASTTVPSNVTSPPSWCSCLVKAPSTKQTMVGVGGANGTLYLYLVGNNNNSLNLTYQYDGQADGRPAINTSPMADINGEWYFGASDGYVYDVEIPVTTGQTAPFPMFKAARFGPGGAITSSPVVGTCASSSRPVDACMYFGSSTAGSYFARIGITRVSDLRACLSSADGSTCVGIPQLWARAQVGPATIWGAKGVYVQGWSYYSP
jgi:hypothetical protein